jgi:hypothetical protein
MLLMALMLMASFSLNNAIHEKIRIQAHSDAQAYSVAILEARTFNTIAFTNRAIAAAMVAQMSLHAWMAVASEAVAIHMGLQEAFQMIAMQELGMCSPESPEHCKDATDAGLIAQDHGSKAQEIQDALQIELFDQAVASLVQMVDDLYQGENATIAKAMGEIENENEMLSKLRQINAPYSQYCPDIHGINASNFACAMEGAETDGECSGGPAPLSVAERSKQLQDTSDGTRMKFHYAKTDALSVIHSRFNPMSDYLMDIQTNEGSHTFGFDVGAGIGKDGNRNPNNNEELIKVGAQVMPQGPIMAQWRHGAGIGQHGSVVISDLSGSEFNQFPGCASEDCFVSFRANPSPDEDFGQPSAYGAVTQDLSWHYTGGDNPPWEINEQANVKMNIGDVGDFELQMEARAPGYAVSKAKAYFHQLDDWQVAPNMFDPFWRAKLHPFNDHDELMTIVDAAGDTAGTEIVGPVEGKR